MATKIRVHNEYVMPLERKKCDCEEKYAKAKGNKVYALGYYHNVKWRTELYFCKECFMERVLKPLNHHAVPCDCEIRFVPRSGYSLPEFIEK